MSSAATRHSSKYDVIVVGAGSAAMSAAVSASEAGATVLVLEKSPRATRGGNSRYAGGARYAYGELNGLRALFPDLITDDVVQILDLEPYTIDDFYADLMRASMNKADPELIRILAEDSTPMVHWLMSLGVQYEIKWTAEGFYDRNGKKHFSSRVGSDPCGPVGRQVAVLDRFFEIVERRPDNAVRYETAAVKLLTDRARVIGVRAEDAAGVEDIAAHAVVLACGGFEANPELRLRYLGPGWDRVKVRGSRYDTGDGIAMAIEIGAAMAGDISGCHAKSVFLSGPDVEMGDEGHADYERCGLLLNALGKRFVDEGSDMQELTNSRVGRLVLEQPGGVAYQMFDAKVVDVLSHYYQAGQHVVADSLEALADRLISTGHAIDKANMLATIREFNDAVQEGNYDPAVLDGKRTANLALDKSNWALRIDTPPFRCYPVTCGITFTYGGLRIDRDARVLDAAGKPISGLYATGEIAGTYFGYMGGSGITKGHVFGRIAARSAIADMASG